MLECKYPYIDRRCIEYYRPDILNIIVVSSCGPSGIPHNQNRAQEVWNMYIKVVAQVYTKCFVHVLGWTKDLTILDIDGAKITPGNYLQTDYVLQIWTHKAIDAKSVLTF